MLVPLQIYSLSPCLNLLKDIFQMQNTDEGPVCQFYILWFIHLMLHVRDCFSNLSIISYLHFFLLIMLVFSSRSVVKLFNFIHIVYL